MFNRTLNREHTTKLESVEKICIDIQRTNVLMPNNIYLQCKLLHISNSCRCTCFFQNQNCCSIITLRNGDLLRVEWLISEQQTEIKPQKMYRIG